MRFIAASQLERNLKSLVDDKEKSKRDKRVFKDNAELAKYRQQQLKEHNDKSQAKLEMAQ